MMKSPSFRMYVLLSLIVHVVVFGAMFVADQLKAVPPKREEISINFLSEEDLKLMAQVEKAAQRKSYVQKNQVVEQNEENANNIVPNDARFLSAKNQKVEKQTVAKNRGEFQNLKKAANNKTGPKGDGKQKTATLAEESRKQIEKDLFSGFSAKAALEKQHLAETESGLGEGRGNGDQNTGKGAESSQTNDYIKDAEAGLETMLNTREFKYYSYYNRIRKQLSQHWEGRVRYKLSKLFKEGRAPAATNQDRVTKLMIVLNDAGTLVRVQVLSDSGIRDLDDAAIEAFRAAAPFPNPPKGIVESDGTVKIRWDFVLEV